MRTHTELQEKVEMFQIDKANEGARSAVARRSDKMDP